MFSNAKDQYVSKKASILITGLHGSGKTRNLLKLYNNKEQVYRNRSTIFLKATESLSEMLHKNLTDEEKAKYYEKFGIDKKLQNKQFILIDILLKKAESSILFIDDIDKFTGKKLEVLKDLVRRSKQFIGTAKDEKEIDKTLIKDLEAKRYIKMQLSTKTAYDATFILFALFLVFLVATNNLDLAVLVMVGKYLMKNSTK